MLVVRGRLAEASSMLRRGRHGGKHRRIVSVSLRRCTISTQHWLGRRRNSCGSLSPASWLEIVSTAKCHRTSKSAAQVRRRRRCCVSSMRQVPNIKRQDVRAFGRKTEKGGRRGSAPREVPSRCPAPLGTSREVPSRCPAPLGTSRDVPERCPGYLKERALSLSTHTAHALSFSFSHRSLDNSSLPRHPRCNRAHERQLP